MNLLYFLSAPSFVALAVMAIIYTKQTWTGATQWEESVQLGQRVPEPLRSQLIEDEREYVHARALDPQHNISIKPSSDWEEFWYGVKVTSIILAACLGAIYFAVQLIDRFIP